MAEDERAPDVTWQPKFAERPWPPFADEVVLRCVEHHRQRVLGGLCPWCVLRQLIEVCRPVYGIDDPGSLDHARDLLARVLQTQQQRENRL